VKITLQKARKDRDTLVEGDVYIKATGLPDKADRIGILDPQAILLTAGGLWTETGWRFAPWVSSLIREGALKDITPSQVEAAARVAPSRRTRGPRRGTMTVIDGKAWEVYEPSVYEDGVMVVPTTLRRRMGEDTRIAHDI
jgi:hypothetical protein